VVPRGLYNESTLAPSAGPDERLAGNEWMDWRQLTPEQREAFNDGTVLSAEFILSGGVAGLWEVLSRRVGIAMAREALARGWRYVCFAEGTPVLVPEGTEEIQNIDVGGREEHGLGRLRLDQSRSVHPEVRPEDEHDRSASGCVGARSA